MCKGLNTLPVSEFNLLIRLVKTYTSHQEQSLETVENVLIIMLYLLRCWVSCSQQCLSHLNTLHHALISCFNFTL